jgi:DNA polymerase III subunit delta'
VSEPPGATAVLPWMRPAQEAIARAIDSDRLGHAVLLQVPNGLGGAWLARWIAARVFCREDAPRPCGQCLDCRRSFADEHPDCSFVQPLGDSKEIRIDQVRETSAALALSSHGGSRKLAILWPADRLNRFAANALLKTLEEPTRNTLLVLVAAELGRLPATVRSRCTRITVAAPDRATTLDWLRAHGAAGVDWDAVLGAVGNRPVTALEVDPVAVAALGADVRAALEAGLAGTLDPVATAERWSRDEFALRLDCIENWITDRVRAAAGGASGVRELRAGAHLPPPAMPLNIRTLFEVLDLVREARSFVESPVNKALVLERLLWRLPAIAGTRGRPGAALRE